MECKDCELEETCPFLKATDKNIKAIEKDIKALRILRRWVWVSATAFIISTIFMFIAR